MEDADRWSTSPRLRGKNRNKWRTLRIRNKATRVTRVIPRTIGVLRGGEGLMALASDRRSLLELVPGSYTFLATAGTLRWTKTLTIEAGPVEVEIGAGE